MPDLDLSVARREGVVADVRAALEGAVEGSVFTLRGSLAAGTADAYSDIDALWLVPGELFSLAVESVADLLSRVRPVAALREDPDERSDGHALLFVRLAGLPMFWRFDLEVRALSSPPAASPPRPSTGEWSLAASALANAAAAIKAVLRGQLGEASGLLERGFARLGVVFAPSGSWKRDIAALARAAMEADPSISDGAAEVCAVAGALLVE